MRVAQVVLLYHPHVGGVETVVSHYATNMVHNGHEVEVLSLDPSGKLPPEENIDGVLVRRFRAKSTYDRSSGLRRYLTDHGRHYDIVHAHGLHTFIPEEAVQGRRRGHYPLVVTGHYHGRCGTLKSTLSLMMYRPIIRHFSQVADGFISVSKFEKSVLQKHFHIPSGKIDIVPNGVDVETINAARPWPDPGVVILIVSRLERYKNIDMAIRALHYVDARVKLMIIGTGPDQSRLEEIARRSNANGRVVFLGRLCNSEMYRWYKTCRLVLNLSALEAFGLSVIEGLAAGKPVLVNSHTALAELAARFDGVTAVNACKVSSRALAEAIMARMGESCTPLQLELEDYKWENIVETITTCYEKVLGSTRNDSKRLNTFL